MSPQRTPQSVSIVLLIIASLSSSAQAWQSPALTTDGKAKAAARAKNPTVWVDCKELTESSGLARSRRTPHLLWTHNDSGDAPRLFAFDTAGRCQAIVTVKRADAADWEDMCSFTRDGHHYLAVADVGDNGFNRKHVTIYGMKEPDVSLLPTDSEGKAAKPRKTDTKADFQIKVTYPDGPLNCEAIAYDPVSERFLLASKEQLRSQLFAVSFRTNDEKQEFKAERIGTFPVPMVTGASITDDGQLLALGTYGPTCLLRRSASTPASTPAASARWQSANDPDLELIPAPSRRQGESICFDETGTKLLMTSEGQPMPMITSSLPKP